MKSACCVCVCGLTFLYENVFQYLFVGNILENMKNKDHLVGQLTTFSYYIVLYYYSIKTCFNVHQVGNILVIISVVNHTPLKVKVEHKYS